MSRSYLFVRCDNSPSPWSSSDSGDEPRMEVPPEAAAEIAEAVGKASPFYLLMRSLLPVSCLAVWHFGAAVGHGGSDR